MEQSIASVLAQHNLQESLLILKDCQARGFDTFCMLRSFQCINVSFELSQRSSTWSSEILVPVVLIAVFFFFRWIISLSFYFLWLLFSSFLSWSFWLQCSESVGLTVWLSFPLLNGGRVRTAFQCSDARHASGTAVAETIRRVCGEASIRTSLEKPVPWLI